MEGTGADAIAFRGRRARSSPRIIAAALAFLVAWTGLAVAQPETPAPAFDEFGFFLVDPAQPDTIYLSGPVDDAALLDFRRAVRAYPDAHILVLNSPGGFVRTALALADEANEAGFSTVIPSWAGCYSACAYIFFAGVERMAVGELGVHQFSSDDPDIGDAQRAMADLFEMLARFDTPQAVITIMLRTDPDDMHIFTADEVASLGINRGFAGGADAFEAAGAALETFARAPAIMTEAQLVIDPEGRVRTIDGQAAWRVGTEEGIPVAIAEILLGDEDMAVNIVIAGPSAEEDLAGFVIGVFTDSTLLAPVRGERTVDSVSFAHNGAAVAALSSFGQVGYDGEEGEFILASGTRWLDVDLAMLDGADFVELRFLGGGEDEAILRIDMGEAVAELLAEALLGWRESAADFDLGDLPSLEATRVAFLYEGDAAEGVEARATWYRSENEIAVRFVVPERGIVIDIAFDRDRIYVLTVPAGRFAAGARAVQSISIDNDLRWTVISPGNFRAELGTTDPRRMESLLSRSEGFELILSYADGETVRVYVDKGASFDRLLAEVAETWATLPAGGNPPAQAAAPQGQAPQAQQPAAGAGPDYTLAPTYGAVTLRSGFLPDPHVVRLVSGGPIDARTLGSPCTGFIAEAPDYRLNFTAGDYWLFISVVSDADTTLIVNTPDGEWYCDDDSSDGLNPMLRWSNPMSGQYDIWVGTYGEEQYYDATLYISEIGDGPNPGGGAAAPPEPADPEAVLIATYRDWEVYDYDGMCLAVTYSVETDPPDARYEDAIAYVEITPGGTIITPGFLYSYVLDDGYYVSAFVDGGRPFDFVVVPNDRYARLSGRLEQAEYLAALRRGIWMEVISVTATGVERWDRFSLLGFTAAYNRAAAECA